MFSGRLRGSFVGASALASLEDRVPPVVRCRLRLAVELTRGAGQDEDVVDARPAPGQRLEVVGVHVGDITRHDGSGGDRRQRSAPAVARRSRPDAHRAVRASGRQGA
jgi:hypothetical protein